MAGAQPDNKTKSKERFLKVTALIFQLIKKVAVMKGDWSLNPTKGSSALIDRKRRIHALQS